MLEVLLGVLFAVADKEGVARAGADVPVPKRTQYVEPQYPARGRDVTPILMGVVVLDLSLNEEGRPVDIKVIRPIPWLDAAAVEAAEQWRYEPTVVNGSPRRVVVQEVVGMFPDQDTRARFWADRVTNTKLEKPWRIEAAEQLSSARVSKKFVLEALGKASKDRDPDISAAATRALEALSNP
jgi:TonB family protein